MLNGVQFAVESRTIQDTLTSLALTLSYFTNDQHPVNEKPSTAHKLFLTSILAYGQPLFSGQMSTQTNHHLPVPVYNTAMLSNILHPMEL
jgi:hypothetical protein